MPYLIRVELPDVPGSLGRVASAIGEAGGDIEAIEIVEKRDGFAVDDVLLEIPPGTMPDSIVSACSVLDGVSVLWINRYAAGGNLFLDLEVVEALTEDPSTARDRLVDLLPIAFRVDWAAAGSRRAPTARGRARHRRRADVVRHRPRSPPRPACPATRSTSSAPRPSATTSCSWVAGAVRSSSTPSSPGSSTCSVWRSRSAAPDARRRAPRAGAHATHARRRYAPVVREERSEAKLRSRPGTARGASTTTSVEQPADPFEPEAVRPDVRSPDAEAIAHRRGILDEEAVVDGAGRRTGLRGRAESGRSSRKSGISRSVFSAYDA